MNLALAALTGLVLGARIVRAPTGRFFLWLFLTLNLLQGTGYWMFSGLGGIGDWQAVIAGRPHYVMWRIGLTLAGVAGYCVSIWIALRALAPFLGATDPERLARANRLTILPYLAGGVLYVSAGLLNPESPWLVLISAAAASFGGASALVWMSQLLHDRRRFPPATEAAIGIGKSWPWLVAGTLATAVFIGLLGPGIILTAAR